MTKEEELLIRKFREMFAIPMMVEPAIVRSVNMDELTCDVELMDETEIPGVRLKAGVDGFTDGLVQKPKIDSAVLICIVGNESSVRCVILFSEVEEVLFYNGANGGLIKIADLVNKLNTIENKVNEVISSFNSHVHSGVTTGAGSSGPSASPIGSSLTNTVREDIENVKVKH
jgi:hypothetical protein